MTMNSTVCVIIAAKNASATVARAVRSALAEAETHEVVVVDDGSVDGTGAEALSADDNSGRLKIIRFDHNRGPAAARNCAIEASTAPLLAILDADDFFLPGRFTQMMAEDQWDFIADNIVFVKEECVSQVNTGVKRFRRQARLLVLEDFIAGNISQRGAQRGEIGFLKPVMRRDFLDRHGLRYNEKLRLGEDYDLYARALVAGARYKIIHSCGYGAVVRHDSLSGKHRTEDLKRLYEADRSILANPNLTQEQRSLLTQHEKHIRDRYELRHFLDLKNNQGAFSAIAYAARHPMAIPAIIGGIAADKRDALMGKSQRPQSSQSSGTLRYLLPVIADADQR
ncbi:glycosyltransferase family 2 protein [Agrobacterium vitis]|uniref:glycosyltransferase family 2 protein n=1 Tax=Agrobacterium vitis TaxID=373 RepID=UPI001573F381|nr:glycosyltransferase [Agrobacterium vitis]NSZ19131.1 glycosyltransferase family 2 protein [Agrobacterium vitis]QZO03706.1 glycosyltransferase family 2 protein [Agrobacterium vitis]UJL88831.1 glycosyltransferase family 2 protein [Agrobacterium vitis]BCH58117.1 glycosyl transferase family A [Agrobacterium vitis]